MHGDASDPVRPQPEAPEEWASPPLTVMLGRLARGDATVEDELYRVVYQELHGLAARHVRRERDGHTLNATGLVHEAYVRLRHAIPADVASRRVFYSLATRVMRRVLIDHARRRHAQRRPGERQVPFDERAASALGGHDPASMLLLEEGFELLARQFPRAEEIARLHLLAGLDTAAIAELLGLDVRTVQRDLARALRFLDGLLGSEG